MKIISVANQKGGVGKTTSAINVADGLARAGYRVALVDLDPQGNATTGLGVSKENDHPGTFETLIGEVPLSKGLMEVRPKLELLRGRVDLSGFETMMAGQQGRERRLKTVLAEYSGDAVIIDCRPALNLLTLNAFVASHSILVPVQSEFFALEGLGQLMKTVLKVQERFNPQLELLGVVMTMFDARNNLAGQVRDEVARFFSSKVFETLIPRNVRLSEAPSFGMPIHEYDPKSSGSIAYEALVEEIVARLFKRKSK